jgi:hypothetical protein
MLLQEFNGGFKWYSELHFDRFGEISTTRRDLWSQEVYGLRRDIFNPTEGNR